MGFDRGNIGRIVPFVVTVVPITIVLGVIALEEAGVDVEALLEPLAAGELPVSGQQAGFVALGAGLTIGGAWCLYVGAAALATGYRIWSNDAIAAGEVHLADDVVEVEGTAEPVTLEGEDGPVDVTVRGEYSGHECLAYTWEKKRKKRDHDDDSSDTWSTTSSGEEAVPFYVADDTGRVAVDPADATLSLEPGLESKRRGARYRVRKYEGRLEPGDAVHVYGQKRHATDGGFGEGRTFVDDRLDGAASLGDRLADVTAYVGAGDGSFKISDTSETRTILRSAARGAAFSLFGVVLLGFVAVSFTGIV